VLRSRNLAVLAVALDGDAPPTEFRIFRVGWNETDNGRFLFDDEAAAAVMAHYQAHQADRMIDLEHLSIDDDSPNYDPDARGWAKLELRSGELWAVAVKWTDDGVRRLREKTQRYISPVFTFDKNRRPRRVVNIALTAIPATHGLSELVAARVRFDELAEARDWRKLSTGVAFGDLQRSLEAALGALYPVAPNDPGVVQACPPRPWLVDVFEASAVFDLGGKLLEVAYSLDGSSVKLGTPVEVRRTYAPLAPATAQNKSTTRAAAQLSVANGGQMNSKLLKDALDAIESGDSNKALEILKGLIASAAGAEPDDVPADPALEGETVAAVEAAAVRLLRTTAKTSLSAALSELETFRNSHLELEGDRAKLAADQAKLDAREYRTLTGELVKLGNEIPATAWEDEAGTVPVERLRKEPLASLRSRVEKLRAARGAPRTPEPPRRDPSAPVGGDVSDLTEREIALCAKHGLDPEKYARTRAGIRSRSQRNPMPDPGQH
jgi:phage I-like protein